MSKLPSCAFVNVHGRCSASVETTGRTDPSPLLFCKEHRQHLQPLMQRLVVETAGLEAANPWRVVVWTTARAQQLLELRMRDEASALLVGVLMQGRVGEMVSAPARDSELVVALNNLARALTPKHPLVRRWREAWSLRWPGHERGGHPPRAREATDLPEVIGVLEAQNAPATNVERRPPSKPGGGGKAP